VALSPQRSNREQLLDGALCCLERLPAERITARAIAEESGANLASIAYHFGSKDGLVTAAVIEGPTADSPKSSRASPVLGPALPRSAFGGPTP
jgi:DNA-binding transcriptional regulator YbjK